MEENVEKPQFYILHYNDAVKLQMCRILERREEFLRKVVNITILLKSSST